jgi:hypothetical protein
MAFEETACLSSTPAARLFERAKLNGEPLCFARKLNGALLTDVRRVSGGGSKSATAARVRHLIWRWRDRVGREAVKLNGCAAKAALAARSGKRGR